MTVRVASTGSFPENSSATAAVGPPLGDRVHGRDVTARFRLGQGETADRAAVGEDRNPTRALGLVAEARDALRHEAGLHGAEAARVAADGAEFFVSDRELERCTVAAAVSRGTLDQCGGPHEC